VEHTIFMVQISLYEKNSGTRVKANNNLPSPKRGMTRELGTQLNEHKTGVYVPGAREGNSILGAATL